MANLPDFSLLSLPSYLDNDEIRQIAEAKKRMREQQAAIAEMGPNPVTQALVGLGGLGADVLSRSGKTDFTEKALSSYSKPFEQTRQLRLKALESQGKDMDSLVKLAMERRKRTEAMQDRKELVKFKADLKGPKDSKPQKLRGKEAMGIGAAEEGLNALLKAVDTVHQLDGGKLSLQGGLLGKAGKFLGLSNEEVQRKQNEVKNMKFLVAKAMAGGGAVTDSMMKDVANAFPDFTWDEPSTQRAKIHALVPKLIGEFEGRVRGLEESGYSEAAKYRQSLESLKQKYQDMQRRYTSTPNPKPNLSEQLIEYEGKIYRLGSDGETLEEVNENAFKAF